MAKQRTVRVDKFRQQIAESVIGNDNLVRVEFGPEDRDFINILIPDMLGQEETKDFNDRLEEARESDDAERNIALLILSGGPEEVVGWGSNLPSSGSSCTKMPSL